MTNVLPYVSNDPPPAAATDRPDPHPATRLLTVTTRPAPPGATVLTVCGEVDMLTSTLLRDHLRPHLTDTVPHVIIDLTGVSLLAAAGLTVLVNARQTAEQAGVTLHLVVSARQVLLPLTITGLEDVFAVTSDLTQALRAAGCGPDG